MGVALRLTRRLKQGSDSARSGLLLKGLDEADRRPMEPSPAGPAPAGPAPEWLVAGAAASRDCRGSCMALRGAAQGAGTGSSGALTADQHIQGLVFEKNKNKHENRLKRKQITRLY